MTALYQLDARQIARGVHDGELKAVDVVDAYLQRIAALDDHIRAFITVDHEGARAAAEAVDQKRRSGASLGPLAGVPIAVKDLLVTKDLATSCGSRIVEGWRPPYDATCIERLRAADAVMLGKTNMDEFGMGSSNENSAFGPTINPWNRARVPGGSSGGSAAAVAAQFAPIALGTDTGGSVRQPASFCGVVGLKPTYGRISRYGLVAFASSLDQVGPLARTAADCALALGVMAGHDPRDATSQTAPVGDYLGACENAGKLDRLRVGVPREYFEDGLKPEVAGFVRAAIEQLVQLGAEIVDVSLPHTKYAVATYYLICTAEASSNLARFDGVRFGSRAKDADDLDALYCRTREHGFGSEVKRRIVLGTFALSAGYYDDYYAKAQRVRQLIRQDFEQAFQQCDVLVTPTSPVSAFGLGDKLADPLEMYLSDVYTISCSLAGAPGISIPCGFDDEGLPVGLQLMGPSLAEDRILATAAAYQTVTDWHQKTCEVTP